MNKEAMKASGSVRKEWESEEPCGIQRFMSMVFSVLCEYHLYCHGPVSIISSASSYMAHLGTAHILRLLLNLFLISSITDHHPMAESSQTRQPMTHNLTPRIAERTRYTQSQTH